MQGTVDQIMRVGVLIRLDGVPEIGDLMQVYRIHDEVETIVGTGYVRKKVGERFKLNPPDTAEGERGDQFPGVQVGDLVRPA